MERREFLIQVGKSVLAVPLVLVATSCGSDSNPAAPAPTTEFTTTSTLDSGHTHRITFQCAALMAGTAVYVSSTDSGHSHSISLTAPELSDILAGGTVGPISSTIANSHNHTWTITKPSTACV